MLFIYMLMFLSECIISFFLSEVELTMTGFGPITESLFLNSFMILFIRLFLVILSGFYYMLSKFAKLDRIELCTLLDLYVPFTPNPIEV